MGTKSDLAILNSITSKIKVSPADEGMICVDCNCPARWRVITADMIIDYYCDNHYIGMMKQYEKYILGVRR